MEGLLPPREAGAVDRVPGDTVLRFAGGAELRLLIDGFDLGLLG
ncbi:hypothetical protein ADIS_4788 [Lunatimonas lonarensis]|uniref:Uncharacterized protein n=1 Tax=Lunatimonas lonarensis TaxID=1232681 RepID=R7ZL60_9BACT|nr:hypothetical protein ADIS_4788 [Lunatimonas lonarensis]